MKPNKSIIIAKKVNSTVIHPASEEIPDKIIIIAMIKNWIQLETIYIQGVPKKSGNKDFLAKICVLEPWNRGTRGGILILRGVSFLTFFSKTTRSPRKWYSD